MRPKFVGIGITSLLLFSWLSGTSQQLKESTFSADGYEVKLEPKQLQKLTEDCSDILTKLSVKKNGVVVFSENICTIDAADIRFTQKGYLTIVERYSSPVGWSEFYVIDLCKGRLVKTKQIEEGKKTIPWNQFIDLNEKTRQQYVDKVVSLGG